MITDCGGLTFIAHQENKKILLTPFLEYIKILIN
jgi:hypothetical protein